MVTYNMKTAWIFPGGSARAVYTAGVVYALSEMDIPKPDYIVGSSGSTGTCMCYVAEQKEIIKEVWLRCLSTKEFVSFRRIWKVLNISYLVDKVLKKDNPLDMDKIARSTVVLLIPLTDSKTGEIEYVSNKMGFDMYEVLRAAISVPFWTNLFSLKGVKLNNKYYSDTPPGARYQLHIQKLKELGVERVIVFDSWHPDDNPTSFFWAKVLTSVRNRKFRKKQFDYIKKINDFSEPKDITFVRLAPPERLSMTRWEIDNANANNIFQRGYQDTIRNRVLKGLYT